MKHYIRWFGIAGDGSKIRRTRNFAGVWGYDVECSCGWQTHTGGAIAAEIKRLIAAHKMRSGV